MPTLITCISTGKGTWTEVNKIIQSQNWNKVFLITNNFGTENYSIKSQNTEFVIIDPNQDTLKIIQDIKKQLNNKILDFEVAINLCSGGGKEHMAMIEAILELGLNFRLVTLNSQQQLEVLGIRAN